ncbi:MAG TPA: haloacid dehalogenase type II [Candidatus Limnocylindrales bacterium]|nr:haloacid dehalogenase type II [Candidatus Limnocylindrales bacterium]
MDRSALRALTFDCYGTLVDWEGGAASFLYAAARRAGVTEPPAGDALRERWEGLQFSLIQGPWRPYREVLAESLAALAAEAGWSLVPGEAAAFVEAMRTWQPFPDTRPALLAARRAGLRLAIVSNTDDDIISHTLRQIGLPVDLVVTAEEAGAYKPAEAPFRLALERLGEPPERVLHVAFGFRYDIGPARRLGFRTAWVNRHREAQPEGAAPDLEWPDLWSLAAFAGGAQPPGRPSTR